MTTRFVRPALAGLMIILGSAGLFAGFEARSDTPKTEPRAAQATYALAKQIWDHLGKTAYGHKANPIDQSPLISQSSDQTFDVYTDCSGFVAHILKQTAPRAYQEIVARQVQDQIDHDDRGTRPKTRWPQAYLYDLVFRDLNPKSLGWQPIADWRALQPGDVLAWCSGKYCTDSRRQTEDMAQPDNTGHVVVVAGIPRPLTAQERQALNPDRLNLPKDDTEYWAIKVIDASSARHFNDPTRTGKTGKNGLGTGDIYFALKPQTGAPMGYHFPGPNFRFDNSPDEDGKINRLHLSAARPLG